MTSIPPTYAFPPAPAVRPPAPQGAPAVERAQAAVDTVEINSRAQRLVAARVPNTVDFDQNAAPQAPASAAMPIYHHPADMNAAATGVELGSRLDVSG